MSKKNIGSLVVVLLLAAGVVGAAINIQYLQDTVAYRQYEPSAAVASLVTDSGMGERGKFLFYASKPLLSDADSFNQQCGKVEKSAAILGCYNGRNIYIYDIVDERLAGVRPTTAAHEMLHAAYKRLSAGEREKIDTLLEVEYDKLRGDKELAERMVFYEQTQPGERSNELHSIIGTEVSAIDAELEAHYKRYFIDRSKVVTQHSSYVSLFTQLRDRADALNAQIEQLAATIEADRAVHEAEMKAVSREVAIFNERVDSGYFTSQEAFNRERRVVVARTDQVDALRTKINNAIAEYNKLNEELGAIATETTTLNRSMDSKIEPAPSL